MTSWNRLEGTWQTVMRGAIEAYLENSVPVGAAVVDEHGTIITVGRNKFSQDRIAHAETESLRAIPATLNRKKASIYSTMEPCPMCTGAIRMMQLKTIHIAARDPAAGSTALLNATKFMRHFECQVVEPTDPTLEFVNVAMVLEHRTRNGHYRWRDEWFAYLPNAVLAGEALAASGHYETWINAGSTIVEIYDHIASCFR
jgi:tRNA(adenine34) deaminase